MSIPAGWYDDGSGTQRWWDGNGWTEHVVDPASSAPAPEAAAQQAAAQQTDYASQPYVAQQYAPPASTNGLAITSLILGILGFGVVAVIFGHIAMGQLQRNPQQEGRGLAIAGLILGYLVVGFWVVLIAFVLFGALLSIATR